MLKTPPRSMVKEVNVPVQDTVSPAVSNGVISGGMTPSMMIEGEPLAAGPLVWEMLTGVMIWPWPVEAIRSPEENSVANIFFMEAAVLGLGWGGDTRETTFTCLAVSNGMRLQRLKSGFPPSISHGQPLVLLENR